MDSNLVDAALAGEGTQFTAPLELRVNDLKQMLYCPRIVFYQHRLPVDTRSTLKMEAGQSAQELIERLEQRRSFRRYGLEHARRRFHVWLSSARLGLSGKLDLLLETPEGEYMPVDFKNTRRRPYGNHLLQLAGYTLLVEDEFSVAVRRGFLYLIPLSEVVAVDIGAELKTQALGRLDEIRALLLHGLMPPPTPVRSRCWDCEYRNYCGDIF